MPARTRARTRACSSNIALVLRGRAVQRCCPVDVPSVRESGGDSRAEFEATAHNNAQPAARAARAHEACTACNKVRVTAARAAGVLRRERTEASIVPGSNELTKSHATRPTGAMRAVQRGGSEMRGGRGRICSMVLRARAIWWPRGARCIARRFRIGRAPPTRAPWGARVWLSNGTTRFTRGHCGHERCGGTDAAAAEATALACTQQTAAAVRRAQGRRAGAPGSARLCTAYEPFRLQPSVRRRGCPHCAPRLA